MSRLGDLLLAERLRRKLSTKQAAKLVGVAENYLVGVEQGKKIIADVEARRILKKYGVKDVSETEFSVEDIAATVDLHTIAPKQEVHRPVQFADTNKKPEPINSVWLDALKAVLKKVPVYNAVMKEVDFRLMPIQDGKIEGVSPDKVFYFQVADNDMRGFRIQRGDTVFVLPATSLQDGAIMLIQVREHYMLRKIKKLDVGNVLLQSFGTGLDGLRMANDAIKVIGRCVRVEANL